MGSGVVGSDPPVVTPEVLGCGPSGEAPSELVSPGDANTSGAVSIPVEVSLLGNDVGGARSQGTIVKDEDSLSFLDCTEALGSPHSVGGYCVWHL